MAPGQIFRIRRTDDPSAHLLLKVTQITGQTRPLDLKLIATEHEHLYHGALNPGNIASLRTSGNRGDQDEWRDILVYTLLREPSDGVSPELLQGLQIVAAVTGEICTVTIRKNIGGIVQRLGSIKLEQDDEREEVSAFEWVDSAVAASDDLRSQLRDLQVSMSSQQDQVAKLSLQLDDLVKAKKEHEDELLQKFAALLNAKKLKIRDQQRLLNAVKQDDANAASTMSEARSGTGKHKPGSSGRTKRKANSLTPVEEDVVALDQGAAADEDPDDDPDDDALVLEEEEGHRTPDQVSTADDSSEDGGFEPPPQAAFRKTANKRGSGRAQNGTLDTAMEDADKSQELPPKRELPFARVKDTKQDTSNPTPVEYQDEDETDDEL